VYVCSPVSGFVNIGSGVAVGVGSGVAVGTGEGAAEGAGLGDAPQPAVSSRSVQESRSAIVLESFIGVHLGVQ